MYTVFVIIYTVTWRVYIQVHSQRVCVKAIEEFHEPVHLFHRLYIVLQENCQASRSEIPSRRLSHAFPKLHRRAFAQMAGSEAVYDSSLERRGSDFSRFTVAACQLAQHRRS